MKQVQVLQHVPFEGLGSIAAWLAAQRADVGFTRLFAGRRLAGTGGSRRQSPDHARQ